MSVNRFSGGHARISSFVDLGVSTSYQLPLASLPPVCTSLQSSDVRGALSLSSDYFQAHSREKNTAVICHVNVLPHDIKILERRIVFTSLVASQDIYPSGQLQQSSPQSNTEPPKLEKPKWEDEQYLDIGKSTSHP